MSESGKDKITLRVSREILSEIDEFVKTSEDYHNRSDFIRDLIKKGKSTTLILNSSSMLVHYKTFQEVLKLLKKDDLEKLTKKTSAIVHSFMQNKKRSSINKISDEEALSFMKEIYESTNVVRRFHYCREDSNIILSLSGDNLHSNIFSRYIHSEVINVLRPWLKLKSSSETPGNLVLIFE